MVYWIALFLLICFNQSKAAMLKFTGFKLLNDISDSGKAFLMILVSDILLGLLFQDVQSFMYFRTETCRHLQKREA